MIAVPAHVPGLFQMTELRYIHTYAKQLQDEKGQILIFPVFPTLLPWACSHIQGWMVECLEWICHVCEGRSKIGVWDFEADAENWVLHPILAERILLPLLIHVCVNTHLMICFEANFSPISLRVCPRLLRTCVNVPLVDSFCFFIYDFE